jgi:hypothetical protein
MPLIADMDRRNSISATTSLPPFEAILRLNFDSSAEHYQAQRQGHPLTASVKDWPVASIS